MIVVHGPYNRRDLSGYGLLDEPTLEAAMASKKHQLDPLIKSEFMCHS